MSAERRGAFAQSNREAQDEIREKLQDAQREAAAALREGDAPTG